MPKESENPERERVALSSVRKGSSRHQLIGRVLELQHAALLVLFSKNKGVVDELNDDVRSQLDLYWKAKR